MRLRILALSLTVGLVGGLMVSAMGAPVQAASARITVEDYERVPMPSEIHVEGTEMDGSVFADARGKTIYMWPFRALRNGITGDPKGKSTCDDHIYTVNAGFMSPYPPGLVLPDVETRPSCVDMWAPVLASAGSKPVGAWTLVARKDGAQQWAYDEHPLYTSSLDHEPGDVLGGTARHTRGETAALRFPVGPPSNVPPGFEVVTTNNGRLLVTAQANASVYAFDKDTATKSMCDVECARTWNPIIAPQFAQPTGEWTIMERSPGVRQWAFRKKPLYINITDNRPRSQEGSDEPGWSNVYISKAPPPPKVFTQHDTAVGVVLADATGKTVYIYNCGDDAVDQLACDHPDSTQAYRLAVCSGGDPAKCLKRFPPVLAAKDAKSISRTWSIVEIDPKTGHRAVPGKTDVLRVWAYRGKPVYTFAGDKEPGDYEADGLGEFRAQRHGYVAFWIRDDFYGHSN